MPDTSAEQRLLDLVADIHGLLDLAELWAGLPPALDRLLPSDWISVHELDTEQGLVHGYAVPEPSSQHYAAFRPIAHEHPLVRHYATKADGRAHRISDFQSTDEYHASELYRDVYAAMAIESQIGFVIRTGPSRVVGFALARGLPDYDDAERELLNRARPFVIQAYRNALAHEELARGGTSGRLRQERALAVLAEQGLTPREAEVLTSLGLGRSFPATAVALRISPRTADKHLQRVYRKLDVGDRTQAVARLWELAGVPQDHAETLIPGKGVAPTETPAAE